MKKSTATLLALIPLVLLASFALRVWLEPSPAKNSHTTATAVTTTQNIYPATKEKETVASDVELCRVFYNMVNDQPTDVLYVARLGSEWCAFRPAVGKAERLGGTARQLSDPDLAKWTEIFRVLEKTSAIPKLPVQFLSGEYEFKNITEKTVTMVRKTASGYFKDNASPCFRHRHLAV